MTPSLTQITLPAAGADLKLYATVNGTSAWPTTTVRRSDLTEQEAPIADGAEAWVTATKLAAGETLVGLDLFSAGYTSDLITPADPEDPESEAVYGELYQIFLAAVTAINSTNGVHRTFAITNDVPPEVQAGLAILWASAEARLVED